jgi:Protein of unknown function (DUF4232)
MRLLLPVLAASAALGLAACGGAGSTSSAAAGNSGTAASPTTSSVKTVTATATATATATGSGTATTGTAGSGTSPSGGVAVGGGGVAACRAGGLALSFLGQQGATGHGELGFELRNTGSASCQTVGYPGIQFLDRSGGELPTTPTHTTQDFFGSSRLGSLALAPGQPASFRLGVTHITATGNSCTTAYGLQVIAPNDTATLRVSLPGGAYECGTATVSPLQSGDSAYH